MNTTPVQLPQPPAPGPMPPPPVPPGYGATQDPKAGRAKIIILLVGIVLLLALGGVAAWFLVNKNDSVDYEKAGVSCTKTKIDGDKWRDVYSEAGYSAAAIEEAIRVVNSGGVYECTHQGIKYERYSESTYKKLNDIFLDEALSVIQLEDLSADQKEFVCSSLTEIGNRTAFVAGRNVFTAEIDALAGVDAGNYVEVLQAADVGDLRKAFEEAGIRTDNFEFDVCR